MGFQNVERLLDIAIDNGYIISGQISTVTENTTIVSGGTYVVDASSGPIILVIAASLNRNGMLVNVKKADDSTNTVTVKAPPSGTIDGLTEVELGLRGENLQIQFFESTWYIL